MAWREITVDDLKSRLSTAELTEFSQMLTASGDPDVVQAIIDQVTAQVRGYIAGCPDNQLADIGLPESLLGHAVSIAVVEIMARSGGKVMDLSGHRAKCADQALEALMQVAQCVVRVEAPDGSMTSFRAPTFVGREPTFGAPFEDGV